MSRGETAKERRRDHRATGRPGRPPASPGRPIKVTFRLSEEEHARLLARVEELEVGQSAYLRAVALGRQVPQPAVPRTNLKAIGELNRIGNNLNQLVKLLHSGKAPYGLRSTLEAVHAAVEAMRRTLAGVEGGGA